MSLTPHQPEQLKHLLPEVPVPEDFEQQLWLRRILRELPEAPVPETFEAELLQRLSSERPAPSWRRWVVAAALLLSGSLALWYLLRPGDAPSSAPFRTPEAIPPVVVEPDARFVLPTKPVQPPPPSQRRELPAPAIRKGENRFLPPPEE
jgi:hypothetical protein